MQPGAESLELGENSFSRLAWFFGMVLVSFGSNGKGSPGCLENFELPISGQSSVLLIGKNGAGKTTVGLAIQILQNIARGTNQVGQLVKPKDVSRGRSGTPIRLEIEVELDSQLFQYTVAFEFPESFKEFRVKKEDLFLNNNPLYTRDLAHVQVAKTGFDQKAEFNLDWHLVALPIIQSQPKESTLHFQGMASPNSHTPACSKLNNRRLGRRNARTKRGREGSGSLVFGIAGRSAFRIQHY